ncbi:MAG: hypothetical protein M9962_07885 [Oligoflexia bacterium]|nr:hypothetical protein [Oligoflexia bacterium]
MNIIILLIKIIYYSSSLAIGFTSEYSCQTLPSEKIKLELTLRENYTKSGQLIDIDSTVRVNTNMEYIYTNLQYSRKIPENNAPYRFSIWENSAFKLTGLFFEGSAIRNFEAKLSIYEKNINELQLSCLIL